MQELLIILFSAILVENFVLVKFLGICPFLGVSKTISGSVGMGGAVIFVMVCATAATHPLYTLILEPNNLGYLSTVSFVLLIALFVQVLEITLKKISPALYKGLGVYLPLIATNCAVLGVTLLNVRSEYGFIESIVNALGAGAGFTLALVLFSGVRQRIELCDIPETFKGVPATLIAASIVSLSFMGFTGLVEGMFS